MQDVMGRLSIRNCFRELICGLFAEYYWGVIMVLHSTRLGPWGRVSFIIVLGVARCMQCVVGVHVRGHFLILMFQSTTIRAIVPCLMIMIAYYLQLWLMDVENPNNPHMSMLELVVATNVRSVVLAECLWQMHAVFHHGALFRHNSGGFNALGRSCYVHCNYFLENC